MVIQELAQSEQNTRDNLAPLDSTRNFIVKRNKEKIILEENSTRVLTATLGESWIVGSSTNGIVGANTGTQSGNQQVVGSSGRTTTLIRVVNPNNIFRERFRDNTFNDVEKTTATVDITTAFRIEF